MNREIEFRGKRVDGKGWVYGDLLTSKTTTCLIITVADMSMPFTGRKSEHEVLSETVGMYVNATDKDKKRLYEGDIVQDIWHGHPGDPAIEMNMWLIQYSEKRRGIIARDKAETDWCNMEDLHEDCKLIGNIHDNPELYAAI